MKSVPVLKSAMVGITLLREGITRMASRRPVNESQYHPPPEGFEYPPRDPCLVPDKKDWRGALFPCNDGEPARSEPPDPQYELLPGERQWMEAGEQWVQSVLQNDFPALQHRLAE